MPSRRWLFFTVILLIVVLVHVVPWWVLVLAPSWPTPVFVVGSVLTFLALIGLPLTMVVGHGRRHRDGAARAGDTWLGVIWQLFVWSVLGQVLQVALLVAGVDNPARSRIVAVVVLAVVLALLAWGYAEAMRVPRVKALDIVIPRLGAGLDGLRVVVVADTHYGPFDRTEWSAKAAATVNGLEPDVACHAGDIADGQVPERRGQVEPLAGVRAGLAKIYITGNHEYFTDAQAWLDHMACIGWEPLHNRALVVQRGGDHLVIAGIDDATAASSGQPGHGANLQAALEGVDPELPVLLLAHQPRQVAAAASAGVDLQISGHTHGGQMWPFHYLTRIDQPSRSGLSRHGERTQLYVSRGSGYWGPPFRIFAPSEISVLTLRCPP